MATIVIFFLVYAFFVALTCADNGQKTIDVDEAIDINLCFALDGSSSISSAAFQTQKSVVQNVVKAIPTDDEGVRLSAVQYGASVTSISPSTMDRTAFVSDLRSSQQLKSKGTFVTAGLNYCISEIFRTPGSKNVIVLFGDGDNNIGSDPGGRASLFLKFGGVVLSVGVGRSQNMKSLTEIAGNDPGSVFSINRRSSARDVSADLIDILFS
ncbi:von Willebrand factor A-like protein [Gracilaria domingensis]|nr:von Willebrand factor A-like protein [Gracilaria domingensis]